MGIDWWILGFCGVVWLAHVVAIARFRRRSWLSYLIASIGIGASAAAMLWLRPYAAIVAAASVGLLLFAPAILLRRANVALRFGKPRKARALARVAATLRPLAEMRRMPRLYAFAEKLAHGQPLDLEKAVARLGAENPLERAVLEVGLLSWTTRFEELAERLRNRSLRAVVLGSALAGPATTAIGEVEDDGAMLRHYERLKRSRITARTQFDGTLALVAAAAYLGADEVVERAARWLKHELPQARLAFALATAQQRAGRAEDAARTISAALERPIAYASYRQMLEHRARKVLPPAPRDEDFRAAQADIATRLEAREVLSALGFDRRAPAPLTRSLALIILGTFAFQLSQPMDEVFEAWGLIRPWSEAPDPVRLVSYALLHVDGWHLSVNLAGLFLFGRFAEHQLGRFWAALAFVAGTLGGAAAFLSFSVREVGVAVGASGAVLALFGVAMARIGLDPVVRATRTGRIELTFLVVLAVLQLVVDAFWELSAGSAHAGGLVTGTVVGAIGTWWQRRNRL